MRSFAVVLVIDDLGAVTAPDGVAEDLAAAELARRSLLIYRAPLLNSMIVRAPFWLCVEQE